MIERLRAWCRAHTMQTTSYVTVVALAFAGLSLLTRNQTLCIAICLLAGCFQGGVVSWLIYQRPSRPPPPLNIGDT